MAARSKCVLPKLLTLNSRKDGLSGHFFQNKPFKLQMREFLANLLPGGTNSGAGCGTKRGERRNLCCALCWFVLYFLLRADSVWMLRYFLSYNTEDLLDLQLSVRSRKQQLMHF